MQRSSNNHVNDDDDYDIYLDKLQTRGVEKSVRVRVRVRVLLNPSLRVLE
jgi:hypothetical protein